MATPKIRIVLFKDGDTWCAQCLEYDIGAQATDLNDLPIRLSLAIQADLRESMDRHSEPFAGIDAAPQHFFDMWDRQSGAYHPEAWRSDIEADFALCA